MRARLLLLALTMCVSAQAVLAANRGVTVRYDPDKPDRKTAVLWLAYLVARTAYHEKHNLPIPRTGEIVPSFAEEVDARRAAAQVYRELKAKDPKIRNAYWEALSAVEAAGFIEPYVWTFHKRAGWPASSNPQGLLKFQSWRRTHLQQHKPQTVGWLEGNQE